MGDFNAILLSQDRLGKDDILNHEIRDFVDCVTARELIEMRSFGNYYSWSNKGKMA